ncbi:MAG: Gfo/Idh/MocA family protein [Leucothrix sp.]
MLRWGMLSTAKIAREQVIPAHLSARGNCISTIASRDVSRAQQVADQFQIPYVAESYEALLQSDQVDAVYIPLPTSQHIEWSIKAANAGKHVLVEKPLALTADDILPVQAAAKANGVIVAEAFMVHYHPQWQQVRQWLSSGAIGRLRHIQGAFSYFNRDPDNMRNKLELGGGGIPDIGVYPMVTARMATGCEPLKIRADVEFDPDFGTDRYANVQCQFADFDLSFYVSMTMALHQSMKFHGEEGYIQIDAPFNPGLYGDAVISLWNQNHTIVETKRFAGVNQYQCQAEAFADAVISGDASGLFSLESSVANQRALDAIFKSNENGAWVAV